MKRLINVLLKVKLITKNKVIALIQMENLMKIS